MHERLFEAALGIASPWSVAGVRFDEASKVLTVGIDYAAASRFAVEGVAGYNIRWLLRAIARLGLKGLFAPLLCLLLTPAAPLATALGATRAEADRSNWAVA